MSEENLEYEVQPEEEIEVIDDTPEADRNRRPMESPPKEFAEDEIASYSEAVQKRIKHFTKGYHEERRAKEAAVRERDEASRLAQSILEENKKLKSTVSQNQEALLEQAKRATQVELEKAKEQYKKAYDNGDSDALVEAQESLTSAKIKADRVANFKLPALQEDEPALKREEAQPQFHPRTAQWVADNPWYGNDSRLTAYAMGFHDHLEKVEQIPVGSEEYWQKIDAEMRHRFPEQFDVPDAQHTQVSASDAPTTQKRTVVAPATRSTAPKKIVLTQSQVNLAKKWGIPLELMAQKVREIEGKGV